MAEKGQQEASTSQSSIEVEAQVEEVKISNPGPVGPGGDVAHGADENQCEKISRRRKRGGRKGKQWGRNKKGTKPRGKEDGDRKAKIDEKVRKIRRARKSLEIPYDEMDINTKKAHALFLHNNEVAEIVTDNETDFS